MNICIASKNKLKRGALQYFICITEGTSTFSSDAPFIFKKKAKFNYIFYQTNSTYICTQYRCAVGNRYFVVMLIWDSVLQCTGILLASGRSGSCLHLCTPWPPTGRLRHRDHPHGAPQDGHPLQPPVRGRKYITIFRESGSTPRRRVLACNTMYYVINYP